MKRGVALIGLALASMLAAATQIPAVPDPDQVRKDRNHLAIIGLTDVALDVRADALQSADQAMVLDAATAAIRSAKLHKVPMPDPTTTDPATPTTTTPGVTSAPPVLPTPVLQVTVFKIEGTVSYGVLVRLFDRVILPRNGKVVEVPTWNPYARESALKSCASVYAVKDELARQLAEFVSDVNVARTAK